MNSFKAIGGYKPVLLSPRTKSVKNFAGGFSLTYFSSLPEIGANIYPFSGYELP